MTGSGKRVYFDAAANIADDIACEAAAEGNQVVLVRDILGRYSVILDDTTSRVSDQDVTRWSERMTAELGPYSVKRPVLRSSDLFEPERLLTSARASTDAENGTEPFLRIDNTIVGGEWSHVRQFGLAGNGSGITRVALYGYKGGVGRTTATFMLAKYLADLGRCVLVVDLDLESPGIGPMLLDRQQMPRFGLVDHLIEHALGNSSGLDLVARSTRANVGGNGEVWVAPARGVGTKQSGYRYIDKLNRVYVDSSVTGSFADRLEAAVEACEEEVERRSRRPDVVLLDSRAGVHDIAAVAISRLAELAFLFGSDSGSTWEGYSDLFHGWMSTGQAAVIRDKVRMVASMVPDRQGLTKEDYLATFREHAWSCFEAIYDSVESDDMTGFNPSPEDDAAPHAPIPILFTPELVGLDSAAASGWHERELVRFVYREFLAISSRLIIGE